MNSLGLGTWETQGPYTDCCFVEQKGRLRSDMVRWHKQLDVLISIVDDSRGPQSSCSKVGKLLVANAQNIVICSSGMRKPVMQWSAFFKGGLLQKCTTFGSPSHRFWQCLSIQPFAGRAVCSTQVPGFALAAGEWEPRYFLPELANGIYAKKTLFACRCSHRFLPNCSLMSFNCFSQSVPDRFRKTKMNVESHWESNHKKNRLKNLLLMT